jgi:hypothetical protein
MTREKISRDEPINKITLLDATDVDTVTAHRLLGQDARTQIHKILGRRLNELGSEKFAGQIRRARRYETAIKIKAQNVDGILKAAIDQYLACVSTWADGAELARFHHALLAETTIDGRAISALDLALSLQEDGVGCQTGTYRERDGSVILWHTEEDTEESPGDRFDRLRLFSFHAFDGHIATGFIYPDLLPGPTFGWRDDHFIQAIDTLHIRQVDHISPILPNMLAWLSLYLGKQFSREELVRKLGPFQGGYSISAMAKMEEDICVEKVEFANNRFNVSHLGKMAGDFLFQTNAIHNLSLPIGMEEEISLNSRKTNLDRVGRTARFINVIHHAEDALPLIFRILRSHAGGDMGYSNPDVKAYVVCHMSMDKTSLWAGCGSAAADDELLVMLY